MRSFLVIVAVVLGAVFASQILYANAGSEMNNTNMRIEEDFKVSAADCTQFTPEGPPYFMGLEEWADYFETTAATYTSRFILHGRNRTHYHLIKMSVTGWATRITCPDKGYWIARSASDNMCTNELAVVDDEGRRWYIDNKYRADHVAHEQPTSFFPCDPKSSMAYCLMGTKGLDGSKICVTQTPETIVSTAKELGVYSPTGIHQYAPGQLRSPTTLFLYNP